MTRYARILAIGAALLLLATGCTSSPSDGTGGGGPGGMAAKGSTKGLTANTIKIGFLGADFGALAKAGLTPDLGDQEKVIKAAVDEVNANGGIAGRKIELRAKIVDGLGGPAVLQAACLDMTQDFGAFAVIIAPAVPRAIGQCISVAQKTLTLAATGFDQALYDQADGRLFTAGTVLSMSTDRQFAGWPQLLDERGLLKGKTIGIVGSEQLPELVSATKEGLLPSLEKLGYKVAVNATLPCDAGGTCTQQAAAVQKLKDGNVDFVFMTAANTVGPTIVQAANNIDYHPQWSANGNQVTDTVAKFFKSVKDDWDGTIGVSAVYNLPKDIGPEAKACNKVATTRGKVTYKIGSDSFGQTAAICLLVELLKDAGDTVKEADLNQLTMIQAIEKQTDPPMAAGPSGTLSATKHNAGNHLFLAIYDAAEGKFIPDGKPAIKVADR